MKYKNIKQGKFISRPNRFIANVEIDGQVNVVHVKNTGRCKELLISGTTVFLVKSDNPNRKTKYDLISVYKGDRFINMDSNAPNKVFYEWVKKSGFFEDIVFIKPESKYGSSRFDFYIETQNKKIYIEVKGVTLEENGVVMFPDAPTERGIKHINELCSCVSKGYDAYIVFIIQMKGVLYFTPNYKTHSAFGEALKSAQKQGVNILALDCDIAEDTINARNFVEVRL